MVQHKAAELAGSPKEYKRVAFEVKDVSDDDMSFEGYASVFGVQDNGQVIEDLDGDVVVPGAFADSIKDDKGIVPVLWQHNEKEPIGWNLTAAEDSYGLKIKGQLTGGDDALAKKAWAWLKLGLKVGAKVGLSIGYIVQSSYPKAGVRYLTKLKLLEYSIVTWPANPMAMITGVKNSLPYVSLPLVEGNRGWDANAARGRVKKLAGEDVTLLKRAFLVCDEETGVYRFPIADVVNGNLMAVPAALEAAAKELKQQDDLPEALAFAVQRHLERYYTKLQRPSPFSKKQKGDEMEKPEQKQVADFDALMARKKARAAHLQEKYDIESTHRDQMAEVYNLPHGANASDPDDRSAALTKAMDQYCAARKAWHKKDMDMSDSGDYGAMEFNPYLVGYSEKGADVSLVEHKGLLQGAALKAFEPRGLENFVPVMIEIIQTKTGKKISAATKKQLDAVVSKMTEGVENAKKALDVVLGAGTDIKSMIPVEINADEAAEVLGSGGTTTSGADVTLAEPEVAAEAKELFAEFLKKARTVLK